MSTQKHRYNLGVKIIAIGMVCLFFINSISYGAISTSTLAPKSPFTDIKSRAELQTSLICELIERRARYKKPLDEVYLDDILLWRNSTEPIFKGCRFNALPGEIRIYLPKNNVYIRYYNSTNSDRTKTLVPNTNWTNVKTDVINDRINRQIIYTSKALPFTIDESKGSRLGSATIAVRIMNAILKEYDYIDEDINIMITFKCPYNCRFCLASDARKHGKARDVDKYQVYSIIDQLKGFNRIHIVGTGEPLAYGKKKLKEGGVSQDFLDIVRYAAARIKEVRIVTNAYLVPEDIKEAEKFFSQFPKNVVWVVSVDKWHERQMQKRNHKSLRRIVQIMEELASRKLIKTAYNIRIQSDFDAGETLHHFGLGEKYRRDEKNVFINGLLYQGNAMDNDIEGAEHLNPQDIINHARNSRNFFPFIDPEGYLVTSDHIAYMTDSQRKKFGKDYDKVVLGNIRNNSLADIIIEKLICRNYLHEIEHPYHFLMPEKTKKADENEDIRTLMNQISIGSHTMRDILQTIIKAMLLHSKGYVEEAKLVIASLDINEKGLKEKTIKRLRKKLYETILNISYHLFTHVEGVDIKSFMVDCLGNRIFHYESDEYRPDIEVAFEILTLGNIMRGEFEKDYYAKWYRTPKWIKNPDPNSNVHIPVYTTKNFRETYGNPDHNSLHKERYTRCYFPGMDSPHDSVNIYYADESDKSGNFVERYLRTYELAKLGVMPIPLGIIHDEKTGEDFYIEEDFDYNLGIENTIEGMARKKENFLGLERYIKSIGRFTARLDNTGLRFKPKIEDVIRSLHNRYLLWVISSLDVLSEGPEAVSAKEAVLYMLSKILNEINYDQRNHPTIYGRYNKEKAEKRKRIVEDSFNEGYNAVRKTKKKKKIPRPKKKSKALTPIQIVDIYSQYIEKTSNVISMLLSDSKDDVLLRIPVEWLDIAKEYIGEERIKGFLEAFQKNPQGYIELYYMTALKKEDKASQEVSKRYGIYKPLPKKFKLSKKNTISLFTLLKGQEFEISNNPIEAKKDIDRLLTTNLGHANPDDMQIVPIGLLNDPLSLIRGTIMGLQLIHIAREKGENKNINKPAKELLTHCKKLCKAHSVENFNLNIADIITFATGNINDRMLILKKLIDLLPITPIDPEELRQIFEYAAKKFA